MDFQNYKSKYHNGKTTHTYVNYKVVGENNTIIYNHSYGIGRACYSDVTYNKIPDTWDRLETWFHLDKLPYSKEKVIEWAAELNKLGFPCYLDFDTPTIANFTVKFADFTKKLHFNATLQLIRCLWESGICHIPDIYFQITEKYKKPPSIAKKFELLQVAHNALDLTKDITGYYNTNHMMTHYNNGVKNQTISLQEYQNRLKENDADIYSQKFVSVWGVWQRNNKE